jgi:hypothetical protein
MRTSLFSVLSLFFLSLLLTNCAPEPEEPLPNHQVPDEVLSQLDALGFHTQEGTFKVEGGYIVENDIFLSKERLAEMTAGKALGIASEEQYHTDNLVTGMPRTILVWVSTSFSSKYFSATDAAIARYNAENLGLSFQRTTTQSQADIQIVPSPWYYGWFGILGSAGFPTASGDPYNQIMLTKSYYDGVSNQGALTTTIAHEMGHCIGFRHTDYMDRSYSCGGATNNEGASDVGANHIPGTPTGPDAASWMLACSDGSDRPFNANDKIALDYLY